MQNLVNLEHLPIYQHAKDIFGDLPVPSVTLLKSVTASGKSLVTPLMLADLLCGGVLLLVPSNDTAQDNARRLAKISRLSFGRDIGLYAGGVHRMGDIITVATYGAYLHSRNLQKRAWNAVALDECHAENVDVEVVRDEMFTRLREGAQFALFEMSATMRLTELQSFWAAAGVDVRTFDYVGDADWLALDNISKVKGSVEKHALDLLATGSRFVMVVRSGMADVENTVTTLLSTDMRNVDVFAYHGETDKSEVADMLSPLPNGRRRIIVTTPRLLTGFNCDELDAIVTDGIIKRRQLSQSGGDMLKPEPMAKRELVQAVGRLGRFGIAGTFVLVSDVPFEKRPDEPLPEVSRISSHTLCLALCALGRNPLHMRFSSRPVDLEGALDELHQWQFIDGDNAVTERGVLAGIMEIRLDLAAFVLDVLYNTTNQKDAALAFFIAGAVDSGGMERRDATKKTALTKQSDWVNEGLLFARACTLSSDIRGQSGISGRSFKRAKAVVRQLLLAIGDPKLSRFFSLDVSANETDAEKAKERIRRAWAHIGDLVFDRTSRGIPSSVTDAIIRVNAGRLYECYPTRRGWECMPFIGSGDSVPLGRESVIANEHLTIVCGRLKTIVPRNGNVPFDILTEATRISFEELNRALPGRFEEVDYDDDPGNPDSDWGTRIVRVDQPDLDNERLFA